MSIDLSFIKPSLPRSGAVVVAVGKGGKLSASGRDLDRRLKGALLKGAKAHRFQASFGKTMLFPAPAGIAADSVMLVGLDDVAKVDAEAVARIGAAIAQALDRNRVARATVFSDLPAGVTVAAPEAAAQIAYGIRLQSYRFDRYHTRLKDEQKPVTSAVAVTADPVGAAKKCFAALDRIADGVFFTRDLVSEPANILTPVQLAAAARSLRPLGVEVDVLAPARLKALGMGALLGVAQGSANEPRVVTLRWRGRRTTRPDLALVGKGVTFDTGGISIKPSASMEDMKWDMGGAGVVLGTMKAIAGRKAKAHVVGVVGLVENMPSGTAQRPGDVVTTMNGQTIEVINTDAEGRLVLADALWFAQQKFKPKAVIDLATLTGAILVALGQERAGLFCNDDQLAERLGAAGDAVNEKIWRFPLDSEYDRHIESRIADMKNVGAGRYAGSIAGAKLLERFSGGIPWAQLDIAGVTWRTRGRPLVPPGGTAFGVRLLDRYVADNLE